MMPLIFPRTLHQILWRGLSQIVQRDIGADFLNISNRRNVVINMVAAAMVETQK